MVPWYYIVSCDKPSFEIGEVKYRLLNEEKKYPTNITWSNVSITFVETTDNVALNTLYKSMGVPQIRIKEAICGTNVNSAEKPTAPAGDDRAFVIQVLNSEGDVKEVWTLNNWWVKNISQDSSDYGSESISKIRAIIAYDWAELELK